MSLSLSASYIPPATVLKRSTAVDGLISSRPSRIAADDGLEVFGSAIKPEHGRAPQVWLATQQVVDPSLDFFSVWQDCGTCRTVRTQCMYSGLYIIVYPRYTRKGLLITASNNVATSDCFRTLPMTRT